ncbi:dienelactone hydrolase family protein [Bacillus solimangrovi]|uniref:Dienelactone hydrolase domain-containing protein n=1 Tax=Bacillus solimangrovi TaxID=1305675 RepID=A0A1E5LJB7_9BACI|nr:dienelactone hydrolase family protein [Bacillus solimangrovi]OEH94174.1 hypothetical protein BFG57_08975 [Bacillus solimangrovi]
MISIKNNHNTVVVVVHEIYGVNDHMIDVCKRLADHNVDVLCPNLLQVDKPYNYSQESIAYTNFIENVGIEIAKNKLKPILFDLKDKYDKVFVLGYSVGATIAWLCSNEAVVDGVVAYYGSRIRDYVQQLPLSPTLLFFPQIETSFDVDQLVETLSNKEHVYIRKMEGNHGFSNPYSNSYHQQSAQDSWDETLKFFAKI